MTFRLPTSLIHLTGLVRPHLLRPDIKAPSIAQVDFRGLRKQGFNAVVIDKDNCLTLPEKDDVHPSLQTAWTELLGVFPEGRVLVVSNSAGTKKDPDGIAAEAVSLSLKAPVLLHNTPKPGCGSSILEYFQGKLGKPNTLRGHLDEKAHAIRKMEDEDRDLILKKLLKSAEEDPLLGPLVDANGKPTKRRGAQTKQGSEESSVEEDGKRLRDKMVSSEADTSESAKSSDRNEEAIHEEESNAAEEAKEKDDLRLLVIGDRLFTDTLLAHRMSKILPKSSPVAPSVISIHTTGLLDPKDVRVLRWLEKKLSGDKLRAGPVDWSRFVRTVQDDKVIEPTAPSVRDRWRLFRQRIHDSRLQWDPRTWTAFDLSVGMGRGIIWIEKAVWRWTAKGSRWVWAKVKSRSSTALAVEGEVTPAPEKAKLLEKQA